MPDSIRLERFGRPGWREMVALRRLVLRTPLGLDFSEAELAGEEDQRHLALWQEGSLLATLLLVPPDFHGAVRLRQMAVRPGFERSGLGRRLVLHAERLARESGAERITLSARESAVGFYAKLGYIETGERSLEITLAHRRMSKSLAPGP